MASTTGSMLGSFNALPFSNEPFTSYAPQTPERARLVQAVADLESNAPYTVHPNVNGADVVSDLTAAQPSPFRHKLALAKYSQASPKLVSDAVAGALRAKTAWSRTSLHDRAAICYRAVALLRGPYRYPMMAATMVGQGKNAYQADIDCYAESLYKNQPPLNAANVWNRTEARPLDGFVYAVSPFNFTALAVNIVMAPLIMGNVVVWKPSPSAIYSNWLFHKIMREAGLPPGVLQFLPGDADVVTDQVFQSPDLGALHFTGSTAVFRSLSARFGSNIDFWKSYPRIVGETGGKNFHLIHPTADVQNAALKSVRAAFEYQGQKCSALSRIYVPSSLAEAFKATMIREAESMTMGAAFTDFMGPVISRSAYDRVAKYIAEARAAPEITLLAGGTCDDSIGFFIRPTIVETSDPHSRFMKEEIFGPFVCIYVYPDADCGGPVFRLVDETTQYALTGAFFARDRNAIIEATEELRFSAGNFYINDQCTGAMPGQQPFGGSRASGTNDKAGTAGLLTRFMSQRTIKEGFSTIDSIAYPSNWE